MFTTISNMVTSYTRPLNCIQNLYWSN